MDWITTLVNDCLALFAILNPISLLPNYSELTSELGKADKRKLFNLTSLSGYLTLVVLMLSGKWIMETVFQISLGEFQIAGGTLLTVIAVKNIVFKSDRKDQARPENIMELGVVPMAIPLLVGPGSIVTGILIYARDGLLLSVLSVTIVFVVIWVILHLSELIEKVVGHFGILVVSRIMWIFIAAIGIHFLTRGVKDVFGI
jgi:multiple antibiotic resistance protein